MLIFIVKKGRLHLYQDEASLDTTKVDERKHIFSRFLFLDFNPTGQIRHGSVERLLERLTDLRFLSIDFLNTFLLTYRVFTTGQKVLDALKKVYRSLEASASDADVGTPGESGEK